MNRESNFVEVVLPTPGQSSTQPQSFPGLFSERRHLSSWKEIAAYVGKGVRTVQRWEAQDNFPVRRPSSERHIVLAIPDEIDAWVLRNERLVPKNGDARGMEELAQAREEIEQLRTQLAYLLGLVRELGGTPRLPCADS